MVENGPSAWENQPENFTLMGSIPRHGRRQLREPLPGARGPSCRCVRHGACGSASPSAINPIVNAARGRHRGHRSLATTSGTAPAAMSTMLSARQLRRRRAMDQFNGNRRPVPASPPPPTCCSPAPFIYCGEEMACAAATSAAIEAAHSDEAGRAHTGSTGFTASTPFPRALEQRGGPQRPDPADQRCSLLNWYKAVIAVPANPALRSGTH